jgi:hypothetical protein
LNPTNFFKVINSVTTLACLDKSGPGDCCCDPSVGMRGGWKSVLLLWQ